jgi:hypothetical protein
MTECGLVLCWPFVAKFPDQATRNIGAPRLSEMRKCDSNVSVKADPDLNLPWPLPRELELVAFS